MPTQFLSFVVCQTLIQFAHIAVSIPRNSLISSRAEAVHDDTYGNERTFETQDRLIMYSTYKEKYSGLPLHNISGYNINI